jgi:hypothetical protein
MIIIMTKEDNHKELKEEVMKFAYAYHSDTQGKSASRLTRDESPGFPQRTGSSGNGTLLERGGG